MAKSAKKSGKGSRSLQAYYQAVKDHKDPQQQGKTPLHFLNRARRAK